MTDDAIPITAAIASCDRPAGLVRCLGALLSGVALPAEVVVVDQSADAAVELAVAGMPTPPVPVRLERRPRRGLSASRNDAVALAAQPLVAFTDDDCVPKADWIATLARTFAAEPSLAAVTGRVLPLGEERPGTYVVSPRTAEDPRLYRGRAIPWAVGTGGNFAAWREWLGRVGGFDERLGAGSPGRAAEDAELLYRLLRGGAQVRYEPLSVVYHERQSRAQRLASRRGYGHGIGALCALYLRHGDWYAMTMLSSYLRHQGVGLARAALQRDWFMVRQRSLSLRGCAAGIRYGWSVA